MLDLQSDLLLDPASLQLLIPDLAPGTVEKPVLIGSPAGLILRPGLEDRFILLAVLVRKAGDKVQLCLLLQFHCVGRIKPELLIVLRCRRNPCCSDRDGSDHHNHRCRKNHHSGI